MSSYAARFHVLIAEAAHNQVGVTFMTSILETAHAARPPHGWAT